MSIEFQSATEQKDALLERMTKIQKLAEGGGTPGEVAAATAMLAKLMQQHGISQAEVELASGDDGLSGYGHAEVTDIRYVPWRETLVCGLARGLMCRVVIKSRSSKQARWDIIGHRDNIAEVQRLYPFLVDLFWQMEKVHFALDRVTGTGNTSNRSLYKRAFLMGCAQGVSQALWAQLHETRLNHEATLIVINDKVKETEAKLYQNLRKAVSRQVKIESGAWGKGYQEGKQTQFRKGVA